MKHLLLAGWLSISVLGAGCGASVPPLASPFASSNGDFFPLEPGSIWIYEVTNARGDATLQRVLVRGPLWLETQRTTGTVVEESGGVAGEPSFDDAWQPIAYYRRGDFLYKYSGLGYAGSEIMELRLGEGEEIVLPADPSLHPEWESAFEVFSVGENGGFGLRASSRAETMRDSVTVRAGRYRNCLRVSTETLSDGREGDPLRFHYVDWYAPGIGLVKSIVTTSGEARPITTIELQSFRHGGDER